MAKLALCPKCGHDLEGQEDGRATWWRYRVRLYDMRAHGGTDPIADSDSNLAQDQDGHQIERGLWKVAFETAKAALEWHEVTSLSGMGHADLERKVRGLRPTLSRKNGRATMRIEYDTPESFTPAAGHIPRYLARVDVVKTDPPEGTVETDDET